MDVEYLERIAQQLVARVRDDNPEANRRWLHAHTTAEHREALLYILAAAVPDTERWSTLTAWCSGGRRSSPVQQEMRRQALLNATKPRRRVVSQEPPQVSHPSGPIAEEVNADGLRAA